ncbi:MAG: hypothetical protein ABSC50_12200 [Candidatus Bathyarchaeia archaeon]
MTTSPAATSVDRRHQWLTFVVIAIVIAAFLTVTIEVRADANTGTTVRLHDLSQGAKVEYYCDYSPVVIIELGTPVSFRVNVTNRGSAPTIVHMALNPSGAGVDNPEASLLITVGGEPLTYLGPAVGSRFPSPLPSSSYTGINATLMPGESLFIKETWKPITTGILWLSFPRLTVNSGPNEYQLGTPPQMVMSFSILYHLMPLIFLAHLLSVLSKKHVSILEMRATLALVGAWIVAQSVPVELITGVNGTMFGYIALFGVSFILVNGIFVIVLALSMARILEKEYTERFVEMVFFAMLPDVWLLLPGFFLLIAMTSPIRIDPKVAMFPVACTIAITYVICMVKIPQILEDWRENPTRYRAFVKRQSVLTFVTYFALLRGGMFAVYFTAPELASIFLGKEAASSAFSYLLPSILFLAAYWLLVLRTGTHLKLNSYLKILAEKIKDEVLWFYLILAMGTVGLVILAGYGSSEWASEWHGLEEVIQNMNSLVLYVAGVSTIIEVLIIPRVAALFQYLDNHGDLGGLFKIF